MPCASQITIPAFTLLLHSGTQASCLHLYWLSTFTLSTFPPYASLFTLFFPRRDAEFAEFFTDSIINSSIALSHPYASRITTPAFTLLLHSGTQASCLHLYWLSTFTLSTFPSHDSRITSFILLINCFPY